MSSFLRLYHTLRRASPASRFLPRDTGCWEMSNLVLAERDGLHLECTHYGGRDESCARYTRRSARAAGAAGEGAPDGAGRGRSGRGIVALDSRTGSNGG